MLALVKKEADSEDLICYKLGVTLDREKKGINLKKIKMKLILACRIKARMLNDCTQAILSID